MFDFQISNHPHFDEACRKFALAHNLKVLAEKAGMNAQTLRNKLNPEQPHQLTWIEILVLTDITEDATLVDGFLAQLHCLPCVPVNEVAKEHLPVYVMKATAEIGQIAATAAVGGKMPHSSKHHVVDSVNSGIRYLSLAALSLQARLQSNPALMNTVETFTNGIGATFGLG
ncbi:phage regulatory CII family protein [Plesiomonas shigelloides]|uniref:Phage regulatory CII family protein n=1 Tax=Plesiomonas shigelloides 302-73 TaxID=1315976 RepID=R8ANE8_PLESH|nr:phage regulatory CII family protein [Plesiomonas shigelloides]EON87838.1 phage regulatory CII family protein [Plesiomonas shigelloides 302-73]